MKKGIHPTLHKVSAHCACGHEFETRSTSSSVRVTLCSQCHPFYTGTEKFVDTAGRIEKFKNKYQKNNKNS
jgi:large subunit ribosomal protein L31